MPEESKVPELAGSSDITKILDQMVMDALNLGASDIHIEPRENDILIRYRIDGILRDAKIIDKKYEKTLIFKIKVNARLRTDEHFVPQDGRIRFKFDDKLDTRISILPVTKGEKVVIRLLSQKGKSFALTDLGFRPEEIAIIERSYKKPYGSIVSSGPTGSGKTTTLYSILQLVNSRDINISTVEDPVEYEIEGVNQVQVNQKAGLTFGTGLRSLLRQDPDVIMIGEIRDEETAEIATNAAMTGHLVLSTIHTNDSVTTIPRLIDMGVDAYLVASTLNVVLAQRLSRRLCEKCKQETSLSMEEYTTIKKLRPDIALLIKQGEKLYKAAGCNVCGNSGYKGRIGLYEILEVTEKIRQIIIDSANTDTIFKAAREQGLKLIVEDGVEKIKLGTISMDELIRVTALKQ